MKFTLLFFRIYSTTSTSLMYSQWQPRCFFSSRWWQCSHSSCTSSGQWPLIGQERSRLRLYKNTDLWWSSHILYVSNTGLLCLIKTDHEYCLVIGLDISPDLTTWIWLVNNDHMTSDLPVSISSHPQGLCPVPHLPDSVAKPGSHPGPQLQHHRHLRALCHLFTKHWNCFEVRQTAFWQ